MRHALLLCFAITTVILAAPRARAEVLLEEDFEDGKLKERGFFDINWGGKERKHIRIVGEEEVKPFSGKASLRIGYPKGSCGGWMHHKLKGVPELHCRYYRYFPEGWEWPKGYGPHDNMITAGKFSSPTGTDLSLYLDFWKTSETFVRVATAKQKWGYAGYTRVLKKKGGRATSLPYNVEKPELITNGKWHCIEFHGKMNDPGKENGRLRLWVNGKLVSDLAGLPLRDENHSTILFDRWLLGPYFHGGSHRAQCNYMDALVVSTEYIGTIEQKGNQPPRARFTYSRDWGSMTAAFDGSRSADPEEEELSFSWDFGDGKSGEGPKLGHTYAAEGEYEVKLTVKDASGQTRSVGQKISVGKAVGSGDGLRAEYFDGPDLKGEPVVLVARQVNFRRKGWNGRFLCNRVGATNYSCRWTGFIQPTRSEEYTLTLDVHEGGRLWWGDELVVDSWDASGAKSVSVGKLEAGKLYPVRIEHRKSKVDRKNPRADHKWRCILSWQSPSKKKQPVPAGQFYPPAEEKDARLPATRALPAPDSLVVSDGMHRNAAAEQEAGRIFRMGRQAERMGQREVARSLFERVVERYPDTYAGKAAAKKR